MVRQAAFAALRSAPRPPAGRPRGRRPLQLPPDGQRPVAAAPGASGRQCSAGAPARSPRLCTPRPGPWPALSHHGQSFARERCPHRKGVDSPRDAVGAPVAKFHSATSLCVGYLQSPFLPSSNPHDFSNAQTLVSPFVPTGSPHLTHIDRNQIAARRTP